MINKQNFQFQSLDWLLLIALSFAWGASFFFAKVALIEWPFAWIVAMRLILALLSMLFVTKILGIKLPMTAYSLKVYAILGLINNFIPFTLFTAAQLFISSSLTAVLNAVTPLSIIALALILPIEERVTPTRIAAVLLGFSGVFVMLLPAFSGAPTALNLAIGIGIATIGSLFYAAGGLFGRRHQSIQPLALATGMILFSCLYSVLFALLTTPFPRFMPQANTILSLIGLGVLSTAVAYMIYYNLLKRVGAANTASVTFLIPVTTITLGVLILDESFTLNQLAGMACIFFGLALLDSRWLKFFKRSP